MADIVERLKVLGKGNGRQFSIYMETAAEIEKLRAALKPFAAEASTNRADDDYYFFGAIKIGHLRAAAAALKETNDD